MRPKGFTLIEILIVIFVMVLLATAALMNFSSSTKTFSYFEQVQSFVAEIRAVKAAAESNREVDCDQEGILEDTFGVRIYNKSYFILEGGCEVKEVDLAGTNYYLEAVGEGNLAMDLDLPLDLIYERGTGTFRAFSDGVLLSKVENAYVGVSFSETAQDLNRYVVIFQLSGLPEVFESLNQLQ